LPLYHHANSFACCWRTEFSSGRKSKLRLASSVGGGDPLEVVLSAVNEAADDSLRDLDERHSFRRQGGTSIQANIIVNLYAKLGVPRDEVLLKLSDHSRSIADIRRELTRQSKVQTPHSPAPLDEITLPAEFALDVVISEVPRSSSEERTVFVTGATGFIGAFAVAELLQQGWYVICAVRNADGNIAHHRIEGSLHDRGLWTADTQKRALKEG
jgi:hypothetical protein